MKSPGVIYRRYRQLKRKVLFDKLQDAKRKLAKNCFYGKELEIIDGGKHLKIHICLYNKNFNNGLDACNHPEGCNAFVYKFSKKYIEDEFDNELKNPTLRNKKYPELNCLEWVLDKSLDDAKKEPSIIVKIIILAISFLEGVIKITANDQKRLMDYK
jgi:hypothetical protein